MITRSLKAGHVPYNVICQSGRVLVVVVPMEKLLALAQVTLSKWSRRHFLLPESPTLMDNEGDNTTGPGNIPSDEITVYIQRPATSRSHTLHHYPGQEEPLDCPLPLFYCSLHEQSVFR
ncbi:hypothetical protein Pmani_025566 [Petrolisthes manimaculis]|uniref:Uncharacterized protein n=1 Tax=Petrolisthes manimaculis TaxID=1843537 RepID=A0AAE1P7P7_9EUCA|nr:hypothetical protein Pmani_025566 [Petrolisthes manimaculis]